jgi:hypothetical protein
VAAQAAEGAGGYIGSSFTEFNLFSTSLTIKQSIHNDERDADQHLVF